MKRILVVGTFLALTTITFSGPSAKLDGSWPQWRGPAGTGVAPGGAPPVVWSEEKNVRWKVVIPGRGHATPIIWGDRIFVATAVETEKPAPVQPEPNPEMSERRRMSRIQATKVVQFVVLALDRSDGSVLWQKIAREAAPHEGTHVDATWASSSPVTDGESVFVSFGSNGLYSYDMNGKLLWEVDLGDMTTRNHFGEGSSPVVHGNTLVLNWDHEGPSFIVALDKKTGLELWRKERDEVTSWSTPLVVEVAGVPQVIVSATGRVRGYDLKTGNIVWETSGMTMNTIPSPVASEDLVFVTSGFRGNALQAIRIEGAEGDISGTDSIVWQYDRDTPYVPSPLLYDDVLYLLKHNKGILSAFDAASGKLLYGPERVEGIENVYASPVGAGDHIYLVGRDGTTVVVKKGSKLEIVATNSLDEGVDASPAIAGGELFLRGGKHLYCIGGGN